MLSCCLKCKKDTGNLNSKVIKTKMVDQCYHQTVLYVTVKKSRFIKEQEAKVLLSKLGLKKPLNKIPLIGDIFF